MAGTKSTYRCSEFDGNGSYSNFWLDQWLCVEGLVFCCNCWRLLESDVKRELGLLCPIHFWIVWRLPLQDGVLVAHGARVVLQSHWADMGCSDRWCNWRQRGRYRGVAVSLRAVEFNQFSRVGRRLELMNDLRFDGSKNKIVSRLTNQCPEDCTERLVHHHGV